MKSPPNQDIVLAKKYNFTFTVAQKEAESAEWLILEQDLDSLAEAMVKAHQYAAWEVGLFTSDGRLYWSSQKPFQFQSSILQHGQVLIYKFTRFKTIRWRVFIAVGSEKAVKAVLNRFGLAINQPLNIKNIERYPKDTSLFEAIFTTPLEQETIESATFQTLQICHKLATWWKISGPLAFDDDRWEFKGQASQTNLAKVQWIEFNISNFAYESTGD